jgi:TetR/AcrR family transcriptional regulator
MATKRPTTATARSPRRAPAADERQRDPERTRQRILEAALHEFADKGFAGARVADIARRAGLNQQLISYYFGGKDGLYAELLSAWHRREATLAGEAQSLADLVVAYLQANHDQPEMARLLTWDELTAHSDVVAAAGEPPEVADIRRRQAEGELVTDLDPGFLLLALMGAVAAGITMPQMAARVCGLDPSSPEFVARYGEQLRRIIGHLSPGSPKVEMS